MPTSLHLAFNTEPLNHVFNNHHFQFSTLNLVQKGYIEDVTILIDSTELNTAVELLGAE